MDARELAARRDGVAVSIHSCLCRFDGRAVDLDPVLLVRACHFPWPVQCAVTHVHVPAAASSVACDFHHTGVCTVAALARHGGSFFRYSIPRMRWCFSISARTAVVRGRKIVWPSRPHNK